jgi:very-short-patch-repair endonuclease
MSHHLGNIPFRDPRLQKHAKVMRRTMPPAEALLWSRLKGKQLGFKFRRQFVIEPYIADFACLTVKVVVESDGRSHVAKQEYDAERDEFLRSKGFLVLRFLDTEILRDADAVLRTILQECEVRLVQE